MKNEKEIILTKEKVKELKEELNLLIKIKRPEVIEELKSAREQGDLSENAEFDVAREKQGRIEDRISEIENILNNSQIAKNAKDNNTIKLGHTVKIKKIKDNETLLYQIVGTIEANPFENKISNRSPLAMALLGRAKGDEVLVEAKNDYKIKIISFE